jgi:hypothetical protein
VKLDAKAIDERTAVLSDSIQDLGFGTQIYYWNGLGYLVGVSDPSRPPNEDWMTEISINEDGSVSVSGERERGFSEQLLRRAAPSWRLLIHYDNGWEVHPIAAVMNEEGNWEVEKIRPSIGRIVTQGWFKERIVRALHEKRYLLRSFGPEDVVLDTVSGHGPRTLWVRDVTTDEPLFELKEIW